MPLKVNMPLSTYPKLGKADEVYAQALLWLRTVG